MRCWFQAGVCKAGCYRNFFFEIIWEAKLFHFISFWWGRFWCDNQLVREGTFLIGGRGAGRFFHFFFWKISLPSPFSLPMLTCYTKGPPLPSQAKQKPVTLLRPYPFFVLSHIYLTVKFWLVFPQAAQTLWSSSDLTFMKINKLHS